MKSFGVWLGMFALAMGMVLLGPLEQVITLIVSVLVPIVIVGNTVLSELMRSQPDWLFFSIPLVLLIGRYAGLRLLEVFRFHSLAGSQVHVVT
jgi:hypothetical protein